LKLKEDLDTAIILITHNLGIIAEAAQRVIVMYAGEMVEEANVGELFRSPLHPYTQGLLKSAPHLEKAGERKERLEEIPGIVPSLNRLPEGCLFCSRCDQAMKICHKESPPWTRTAGESSVRCWLYSR
jgi:oligopeptide/dipeptide ABC transporter ATP-binding protein